MNNIVDIIDLTKTFEDGVSVLKDINLSIKKNEFLTLLGPSGCGKTTLLRILGGFAEPTEGKVLFEGKNVVGTPPYKRRVNTVFQKYALFPHLNVAENIAFGLNIKKKEKSYIKEKVSEMLELVNLEGFEGRKVDSLSGGQQQRIAIARALVNEPEVLLLDEPLGALDLKLRKGMQTELKKIQQKLGITFIFVTHDQEEALTMSDTIVVMKDGNIQQIGSPVDIYNEPENAFIADFIGESNILEGNMLKDGLVRFNNKEFVCVDKGFKLNEAVDVVIRPEDLQIVKKEKGMMEGIVENIMFRGVHYEMEVKTDYFKFIVHSTDIAPTGQPIGLRLDPEDIHVMHKIHV
ncbi:spermidine/putrescine ABC transporter ATP-binding protein [Candidatus Epulonipiscium fishelsonii]|uniref:Spermidine/putrescine ABC transporter ATP-binding protein n=1 Tax=Candidatus Epulonipiscium fishelsonii TaxID=77094 RepID=A0ACC8XEW6_9FIRM|nr:spermidine/putrescine ABC transporter ATP-binding protein [Epulopiscium sp. SCG-B11WGA-EpuloA1]